VSLGEPDSIEDKVQVPENDDDLKMDLWEVYGKRRQKI